MGGGVAYCFEAGAVGLEGRLGDVFGEEGVDGLVAVGIAGLHGPVGVELLEGLRGEAGDVDGLETVDFAGDGFEGVGDGVGGGVGDGMGEDVDVEVALQEIGLGDGGFGFGEVGFIGEIAGVEFVVAGEVGGGVEGRGVPGEGGDFVRVAGDDARGVGDEEGAGVGVGVSVGGCGATVRSMLSSEAWT